VDSNSFYSKGRNCPFNGWELYGKAILTIVAGRIVAKDGKITRDN
jgi:dihydroorotase